LNSFYKTLKHEDNKNIAILSVYYVLEVEIFRPYLVIDYPAGFHKRIIVQIAASNVKVGIDIDSKGVKKVNGDENMREI
jgi:MinD-like ATPase involved in chromosome partitioning or flagellar assembly